MALADYSGMEKEVNEVPDAVVLKKGTEVRARIITVRSGISDKNNATWYSVVFEDTNEPLAKEFNDFFWDPLEKDKLEPKQYLTNLRRFRDFVHSFGIDLNRPFDWEDELPGKVGWLIVGVRNTEEYGPQNTVQKYLAGGVEVGSSGPEQSVSDDEAPF